MSGSKKISELTPILNSEISASDVIPLVDVSISETKTIAFGELDLRYVNHTEFNGLFDDRLNTKNTGNLTEGSNLYWTQGRFDDAFAAKDTSDLSEGSQLYYTEARVSDNSDVSANTAKRHNPLTLDIGATNGGLSLADQDLSHSRSDSTQNGYLHQDDFNTFNGKSEKNTTDIDTQDSFDTVQNNVSASDVTGLSFPTADVRAFEALVTVYIEGSEAAPTKWYGIHRLFGINKGGSWNLEDVPASAINDDHGVSFSIDNTGNVEYTTPDYNDSLGSYYIEGLSAGSIKFRAITIEK